MILDCYTGISEVYHLIFENWKEVCQSQEKILAELLPHPSITGPVLDCSCGIGTQSLALAALGYAVDAIDLSAGQIERAKREARARQLSIRFSVDDMRKLRTAPLNHYGAVISMDNSLPHLDSDEDILTTFLAVKERLKSRGYLLLSVRDYAHLIKERPMITTPKFFYENGCRRIFHQVWDWMDQRRYKVHFYISCEMEDKWEVHHSVGQYRAITAEEVVNLASQVGFTNLEILAPSATGFYQPIIRGIAR